MTVKSVTNERYPGVTAFPALFLLCILATACETAEEELGIEPPESLEDPIGTDSPLYSDPVEEPRSNRAPEGAVVLFDGTDFSHWVREKGGPIQWRIDNGVMQVMPGSGSIHTKEVYGDFRLHVQFKVPELPPLEPGQDRGNRGNSGIYLQRRYEVQILDSFGFNSEDWDCGALYRARKPDHNASRKAGQWQYFDITFHQPRYQGEGEGLTKVANARITVLHNEVVIHDDVELANKTGLGKPEGPEPGPILLQDHGNAVEFLNIWILPLDR